VRVLELGKFYWPERGGIETLLKSWSEGLAAKGARVDCVVANRAARTVREELNGVLVHRLASFGQALSTALCPAYPFATRRLPADVWHAHFPNPLADVACLLGNRRTPLVLSYHSDVVRQKALMSLYSPLKRALLRRADRIVVATPNHIEFSEWLPAWREKCQVIPFGLDLDRFLPNEETGRRVHDLRAPAGGRPILLNVGRLVGYKGQRYAIEAMRGIDAVLWLVGTGPLESDLKALAAQCGVTEKVKFWGEARDTELPLFFHSCDVFVFPSITPNEAFGLVQVEAMACGKPVVACNLRSGVPYVCAHGATGLVVPPADAEALANAIQQLLKDHELRHALGENGRQRARAEFEEGVMVDRYWQLMHELVKCGGRP
jgi:rhamnosyl/mannosyltransferase